MSYEDDDCTQADYDEFASNFKSYLKRIETQKATPKAERRAKVRVWTEKFPICTKLKSLYKKIVIFINNQGNEIAIIWLIDGTRHFGYIDAHGWVESDTIDYLWWHGEHRLECHRNKEIEKLLKEIKVKDKADFEREYASILRKTA